MTYTSLCFEQIKELSYVQYKEIINAINTKLNWDVHLNTLSVTGEFKNELSPLYSEDEDVDRVFKMSDAVLLKNMANG